MIIVIEPQCIGWQHESANAGFLWLLSEAVPNEEILFLAEKSHITYIREMYKKNGLQWKIKCRDISLPEKIKDSILQTRFYYNLINGILSNESAQITKVILLSSHRGNISAVKFIAKKYKNINFTIVLHGLLEQVINKTKRTKNTLISLKTLMNFNIENNVNYITFSPCIRQELYGVLKEDVLNKVNFMHLPFINEKLKDKVENEDSLIRIALIGACANNNAYNILKDIDNEIEAKCIIEVLVRSNLRFEELSCVRIKGQGREITRDLILDILLECDYILLPYDKKEYKVMMSGILFDAIETGIPILSLDNNPVVWYNQYNIGHVYSNVDELRNGLLKLAQWDNKTARLEYVSNLKKLKTLIINQNKEYIKNIINKV